MSGMHNLPADLYIKSTDLHFSPQLATKPLCMQLQSSNACVTSAGPASACHASRLDGIMSWSNTAKHIDLCRQFRLVQLAVLKLLLAYMAYIAFKSALITQSLQLCFLFLV